MAGYIKQRGKNSWLLTVYVGYDGKAKKRRYANKTVHGGRRDAERQLAAFVTDVSKNRTAAAAADPVTVSEVLDRWLKWRTPRLSPSTVDRYRVATLLVEPVIGSVPVARLRPHHIEDLYAKLLAEGQSGSSIRKVHWAMRQSLAWAHRRGFTATIATDGIELPPLGARKIEPPASDDVRTVIETTLARDPDWGTVIAFIAWTGCRRGELCGLRWDDIDFKRKSVLIRRAVVAVPGGWLEKEPKTGELRRLALGSRTLELLQEHRDRCAARARECDTTLGPKAYVFSPDPASRRPYNPHTVTRAFVFACDEAQVPPMRLHDLRHHSATTLLKNGAAVGEVMDRHGWRTVEMVNRYRHLLEAEDTAAAEALENA